jgi:hypothetical protein
LIATYNITGVPQQDKYNYTGVPTVIISFERKPTGLIEVTGAEAEITVYKSVLVKAKKSAPPAPEDADAATKDEQQADEQDAAADDEKQAEKSVDTEATAPETGAQAEEDAGNADTTAEPAEAAANTESTGEADATADATADSTADSTADAADATTTKPPAPSPATETKLVKRPLRIPLKVSATHQAGSMSAAQLNTAKSLLRKYDNIDKERKQLEKDRNELEAYIYETKHKLESTEYIEASTSEERESLSSDLLDAGDWLYDDGESATSAEYRQKLRDIRKIGDRIAFRIADAYRRPAAILLLRQSLDKTRTLLLNITAQRNVTEDEYAEMMQALDDTAAWLKESDEAQKKLAKHQDPLLTSDDLVARQEQITKAAKKLLLRPKLKPPTVKRVPKPKKPDTQEPNASAANDDEATAASNDAPAEQPDVPPAQEVELEAEAEIDVDKLFEENAQEANGDRKAEARKRREAAKDEPEVVFELPTGKDEL